MDVAAEKGHLEVVQWLHSNRMEGGTTLAMDMAASSGHLEIVQWLHEHRSEECTTRAMDFAASHGHLHIVQWLHENRREGCTTRAMDHAGSLEVVQWLYVNRVESWTVKAMDYAASHASFDILIFLRDTLGMRCTESTIASALLSKQGEAVQWAITNCRDVLDVDAMKQRRYLSEHGTALLEHLLRPETTTRLQQV